MRKSPPDGSKQALRGIVGEFETSFISEELMAVCNEFYFFVHFFPFSQPIYYLVAVITSLNTDTDDGIKRACNNFGAVKCELTIRCSPIMLGLV